MKRLNPHLAADANTLRGKIDGTVKVGKEINDPMVQFMIKVMDTMGVVPNEQDENEVNGYQLYTAIAKFIQKESWGEKVEKIILNEIQTGDNLFLLSGNLISTYFARNVNIQIWIKSNSGTYYKASFSGEQGEDRLLLLESGNNVTGIIQFGANSIFNSSNFQGLNPERIVIFVTYSTENPTT